MTLPDFRDPAEIARLNPAEKGQLLIRVLNYEDNVFDICNDLILAGADLAQQGDGGYTPLLMAILQKQCSIARLLIRTGAPVDQTDGKGNTPLMFAASSGYNDVVEVLIERGVNLDARDLKGNTALILASAYGNAETVSRLVSAGAGLDFFDHSDRTALDCARNFGNEASVAILEKALGGILPPQEKAHLPEKAPPSLHDILRAKSAAAKALRQKLNDTNPGKP